MPEPTGSQCPLCGSVAVEHFAYAQDLEYLTDELEYEYLSCPACLIVFLRDPPVDRLDQIYPPNYYSHAGESGSRSVVVRAKEALDRRWIKRLIDDAPAGNLRVLDIGGGSGWMLSVMRKASPRVTETHVVDVGEGARASAEAAGHIFHSTRIEDFTTDLQFDLVIMLNMIEHVADPAAVLDALRPVLAPGGKLLIKTPNYDTLDCRLFKSRYWGGFHCPRHFVLFCRDSLAAVASEHGFRVARLDYTQGAPQWTPSVMAWMYKRGWIALSPEHPMHEHRVYAPLTALFAAFDFARLRFSPTAQMVCELRPAAS